MHRPAPRRLQAPYCAATAARKRKKFSGPALSNGALGGARLGAARQKVYPSSEGAAGAADDDCVALARAANSDNKTPQQLPFLHQKDTTRAATVGSGDLATTHPNLLIYKIFIHCRLVPTIRLERMTYRLQGDK
jgi:hypothetical protein